MKTIKNKTKMGIGVCVLMICVMMVSGSLISVFYQKDTTINASPVLYMNGSPMEEVIEYGNVSLSGGGNYTEYANISYHGDNNYLPVLFNKTVVEGIDISFYHLGVPITQLDVNKGYNYNISVVVEAAPRLASGSYNISWRIQ